MSNMTFLTFMIKAKSDAHIALSANYGELHKKTIEVVIGGENNTRSMIKDGVEGSVRADALTANILSGTVSPGPVFTKPFSRTFFVFFSKICKL